MNTPLIKWTGSKRHIASKIVSFFPKTVETYYEPFLGGGSVFFHLLKNHANIKRYELSDINSSLIEIYNVVKNNPDELILSYKDKWKKLQKDANYFYEERDHYNKTHDFLSFYFLTRTCYNGTIRYNKNGDFNTSHHFGRTGMTPDKVEKIVLFFHQLMKGKDLNFTCKSFEEVIPDNKNDAIYLDPPYTTTKSLYFGNIDFDNLLSWIKKLPCSWFMNINSINVANNEETITIPYTGKEIFSSGNSSFSRMKGDNIYVGEYFYYNLK